MSSTIFAAPIVHAATFLTTPLSAIYSPTIVMKVQLLLEANLTALCSTWNSRPPSRKCLLLTPQSVPPRPIYATCIASGIRWSDWIACLGGGEFELVLQPGCVTVCIGSQTAIVWQEENTSPQKTVAQRLIEEDDGDEMFAMIAHRISVPITAPTPTYDSFTSPCPRSASPIIRASSTVSDTSSACSDSGYSFFSSSSQTSASSCTESSSRKLSRREKTRTERVFVDKSKNVVTKYDGGKTNVLTGGVMLGAPVKATKSTRGTSNVSNWRQAQD